MTVQEEVIDFRSHKPSDASAIESLCVTVFSRSEGPSEGALIGKLARELMAGTEAGDLRGFVAVEGDQIVGTIFFSRLTFEQDIAAFILAPVAVHTDSQGRGIGQALIAHGLHAMKEIGVKLVIVYGDPNFYGKVGFHAISPDVVAPPFELSQPVGWLGQSLSGDPIERIPGRSSCVQALNDPTYW